MHAHILPIARQLIWRLGIQYPMHVKDYKILAFYTKSLTHCRENFLTAYLRNYYVDGVHLSGSTAQLIIHGLLEVSMWNT